MADGQPTPAQIVAQDKDQEDRHPEKTRANEQLGHRARTLDVHEEQNYKRSLDHRDGHGTDEVVFSEFESGYRHRCDCERDERRKYESVSLYRRDLMSHE